MRRLLVGVLLSLMVLGAAMAGRIALFAITPFDPSTQESTIILLKINTPPKAVTSELGRSGIISDTTLFYYLGKLTGKWRHLKVGEYKVSAAMSPLDILRTLNSGISIFYPLTIKEGDNMYQVADQIQKLGLSTKAEFIQHCTDPAWIETLHLTTPAPRTLEGYLFPETYHLNRTMTAKEIIKMMISQFEKNWTEDYKQRAQTLGLTPLQTLILASMVEKETGAPSDRPLISSVFHNRLKKKMRLQSDPTTIYGIWGHYTGNLHKADLLEPSPYNTYTVAALPLGPIANPGKDAIHAALYPAETNYLYFVSKNDGTTTFSESLDAHNKAVKTFQVNPAARAGKSWRNLKKKH